MPASPAADDTRDTDRLDEILRRFNADEGIKDDDHEWLIEQVARLRKSRHVHKGQQLADLLRTATEFVDAYESRIAIEDEYTALRAAVRALQGPPAPFRPQQAHAAPAHGGAA